MNVWERYGLSEFLYNNRGLRLKELSSQGLILEGLYNINAQMDGYELVSETVNLRIQFDKSYPKEIPKVVELDSKIPRSPDYHVNAADDTCCLGSNLRLLDEINRNPNIDNYFSVCVNPFFYSVLHKIKHGVFPYGELAHYEEGLVQDYEELFNIKGKENVILLLKALSKRERLANKLPCPCNCGCLLGKCNFRNQLAEWRTKAKRRWYLKHLKDNFKLVHKPKRLKKNID